MRRQRPEAEQTLHKPADHPRADNPRSQPQRRGLCSPHGQQCSGAAAPFQLVRTAGDRAPFGDAVRLGVLFLWFFFFLGAWKLCLLGLLAALCISAVLRPALFWLPGPRPLKGFLLGLVPIIICAGLLTIASWMLVKPVQNEMAYLPTAVHEFDSWLAGLSARFGAHQPITVAVIGNQLKTWFTGSGLFRGVAGNVIDIVIGMVFVFIGTIYLLAERSEDVLPPILRLLPPRRQAQSEAAIKALEPRLRWWLIGAMATATIIGLTSLLGFWLIGLKLWVPLAILAGLSEFVPTIGPACAFLLALAFAATQGVTTVLWLCGLYVFVHILESYILIPVIYKEAVRIPPIVTLFTVVLWGEIFGIGGLLLAVPINLFLWTVAEHFFGERRHMPEPEPHEEPLRGGELARDAPR